MRQRRKEELGRLAARVFEQQQKRAHAIDQAFMQTFPARFKHVHANGSTHTSNEKEQMCVSEIRRREREETRRKMQQQQQQQAQKRENKYGINRQREAFSQTQDTLFGPPSPETLRANEHTHKRILARFRPLSSTTALSFGTRPGLLSRFGLFRLRCWCVSGGGRGRC
jgi:hypothetical protein